MLAEHLLPCCGDVIALNHVHEIKMVKLATRNDKQGPACKSGTDHKAGTSHHFTEKGFSVALVFFGQHVLVLHQTLTTRSMNFWVALACWSALVR